MPPLLALIRFLTVGAVALLSIAGSATAAAAQDTAPTIQPADTALARQLRAVETVMIAHRLGAYGQRERRPMALIAAAEILLDNPARPLPVSAAERDSVSRDAPDAIRLIAVARTLAAGDQRLLDIIAALERRARAIDRGSARGPRQLYGRVASTSLRQHTVEFRGGEPAVVYVSGDGDSDLDLFVYDAAGKLVASATGAGHERVVRWRPERLGPFRVEVRNVGPAQTWYWMVTN